MGLELTRDETFETVAEVFHNEDTGERTFTAFEEGIPLEAVELLVARAQEEL